MKRWHYKKKKQEEEEEKVQRDLLEGDQMREGTRK